MGVCLCISIVVVYATLMNVLEMWPKVKHGKYFFFSNFFESTPVKPVYCIQAQLNLTSSNQLINMDFSLYQSCKPVT